VNVNQLRELIAELDGETEVRLMTQPVDPFEWEVVGAVTFDDLIDYQLGPGDTDPAPELYEPNDANRPFSHGGWCGSGILWLLPGEQLGYGTSDVWDAEEAMNG
jgi:hypothetical protein